MDVRQKLSRTLKKNDSLVYELDRLKRDLKETQKENKQLKISREYWKTRNK